MNCEEFKKMMLEAGEGETSSELESHLKICDVCSSEWESLSVIWKRLGDIKDIEPSLGFKNRVWKKIDNREKRLKKGLFQLFPRQAWAVPVVLFLMIIGLFYSKSVDYSGKIPEIEILEYDIDMINNMDLLLAVDDIEEIDLIGGINF